MALLDASLAPPCQELNELDWKVGLSPNKKRVVEHLCALGNHSGGGFLVFGINQAGVPIGVRQDDLDEIATQLANLARDGLEPPLVVDYQTADFAGVRLFVVFIIESPIKPVRPRGKPLDHSYIRSGGTTRAASRQEIGSLMLASRTPRWEDLRASSRMASDELLSSLRVGRIVELLGGPERKSPSARLELLTAEGFIELDPRDGGYITNLGAIAAARSLDAFPDVSRKAVRVVVYEGASKERTRLEQEGQMGYAVSFQGLLEFVISQLPQSEVIEKALRQRRVIYPEIALRELIANALIHQDFGVTGAGPLIEIYADRLTISNPGGLLPSKQIHRLIGTHPESRNEKLARAFRRYKICEERGSGLIKAGIQVELYGLPPIRFEANSNSFAVTLFRPRSYAQMSHTERLEACYQHAVLRYFTEARLSNKSLRERLNMPERHRSMVSTLIQQAIDAKLIKPADEENRSRKFAEYVPYWAD